VADAEVFHIRHQRHNAVEGHAVTELNTVRGGRDHNDASPSAKRTTIPFGGKTSDFRPGKARLTREIGQRDGLIPIFSARESVPDGKRQLTATMPGAVLITLPSTAPP
jgi:hypothetical protein